MTTGLIIEFSLLTKSRRLVKLRGLIFCISFPANVFAANEAGQALTGFDIFLKYCAGCHGFDGFAKYEHAPSFSMGERLHKSDPA